MEGQESASYATQKSAQPLSMVIADPKPDEPAALLFSHGAVMGTEYHASMSSLHYSDPAAREFGPVPSSKVPVCLPYHASFAPKQTWREGWRDLGQYKI